MKEQFVSYEIAMCLCEMGFNKPCCAKYYRIDKDKAEKSMICCSPLLAKDYNSIQIEKIGLLDVYKPYYSVPTWQQAIDWLRDKHNLFIVIKKDYTDGEYYGIESIIEEEDGFQDCGTYKTYEEARESAILKALELIKK